MGSILSQNKTVGTFDNLKEYIYNINIDSNQINILNFKSKNILKFVFDDGTSFGHLVGHGMWMGNDKTFFVFGEILNGPS